MIYDMKNTESMEDLIRLTEIRHLITAGIGFRNNRYRQDSVEIV